MATAFHPQIDIDLCYLLDTLSLKDPRFGQEERRDTAPPALPSADVGMVELQQPVQTLSKPAVEEEHFGCGLLQAAQAQVDSCQTTGPSSGEYLDIIFTHRELLFTFPQAHKCCARAFTDLARAFETRGWRADRDGDPEAVAAFRNEAWMIAERWCPQ
ncbi:hypothetical protein GLOTRDRAFT_129453 [Gloeophyllum trabeum ATCC 11539]|uniref:Uncharacterized protein n=1 Tax=Gloeophyllum trabeum (strain ATCC 11539 / FP-39264 / Madison 617) TaxID=670483 RepID=S7Q552_GLOTA|nr:uncharacterized protein GLOTRDRAFT_129453 [Gloeophyllum trabeum ATCC 11539]EPQ55161.1 hypothetical protein GLOTRDRAFT_129453 [Gloeophyllum trabeum ATCC 11539]